MANYASLLATINNTITDNNAGEIDGPALNDVLTQMVAALGTGYEFVGVATPSTSPISTDAKVFYIAGEAGTYTNFGGLVVADGEVAIFKYDTAWSKISTPMASASEVSQLGQKVDELNVFIQVVQDGFYFVDSAMNIGIYIDANGIHANNILDYQIVNL